MINYKKANIAKIILGAMIVLFIICSLQTTFANDYPVSTTDINGINGALLTAVDGDTISLETGTYSGAVNNNLKISASITFEGSTSGQTIINGENTYQIASIDAPDITVTFNNIKFINGISAGDGGAIFNGAGATVIFYKCIFEDNTADTGGAIENEHGTIILYDCEFYGNIGDQGGAIYNWDGTTYLYGCIFNENDAREGGAIYNAYYASNSIISLYDCTFNANGYLNLITEIGGAIYNNGKIDLIDCQFEENWAEHGGAIYNADEGYMAISGSNSQFIDNYAFYRGGAIFNKGEMTVSDCTFDYNEADVFGGAIFNDEFALDMTISDCIFTNNRAARGAGISNNNLITISDCTFISNWATDLGGAIFNDVLGDMYILDSTFDSNAADQGGAIFNWNILYVSKSNFIDNKAIATSISVGGAICTEYGNVILDDCKFEDNSAYYRGGAVYQYSGTMTVSGACTFKSNKAFFDGGGAIYKEGGDMALSDCTFNTNAAPEGGAIYQKGSSSTLDVTGCNIISNDKAIYIEDGIATINYNRIFDNTGYDLDMDPLATVNVDADYNWWGDNNPTLPSGVTYYFKVYVDLISFDPATGTFKFDYSFKLNDASIPLTTSRLPDFTTNVISTGSAVVAPFDAKTTKAITTTESKNGLVTYTFKTDNNIIIRNGTVNIPTPTTPVNNVTAVNNTIPVVAVKKSADLVIGKIIKVKSKNKKISTYKITIKNAGNLKSKACILKFWHVRNGKTIKAKYAKINALDSGKSITLTIRYYPDRDHHKFCKHYFMINPNKSVSESSYKNNLKVIS